MSVKASAVQEALDSIRDAERKLEQAQQEVRAADVHEAAAATFARTLQEVLGDRAVGLEVARRAALTAASSAVWEDAVGPLLSGVQVRALLGGVTRQRLDQLLKSGKLLALPERSGSRCFPAWQFDDAGGPLGGLAAAHRTLVETGDLSPWTAASWCVHAHPELAGSSPREWALAGGDAERLAEVARRDAGRAAQ